MVICVCMRVCVCMWLCNVCLGCCTPVVLPLHVHMCVFACRSVCAGDGPARPLLRPGTGWLSRLMVTSQRCELWPMLGACPLGRYGTISLGALVWREFELYHLSVTPLSRYAKDRAGTSCVHTPLRPSWGQALPQVAEPNPKCAVGSEQCEEGLGLGSFCWACLLCEAVAWTCPEGAALALSQASPTSSH